MKYIKTLILIFLIDGSLFGQTESENINEPQLSSFTDTTVRNRNVANDSLFVSLLILERKINLVGLQHQLFNTLFINNKSKNILRINSLLMDENQINEFGEKTLIGDKEKTVELSFYDSINIKRKTELIKIMVDCIAIDSVYQSEFSFVKKNKSKIIAIDNSSIKTLNKTLNRTTKKYKRKYWLVLERFSFYYKGELFEIPENIGFYCN